MFLGGYYSRFWLPIPIPSTHWHFAKQQIRSDLQQLPWVLVASMGHGRMVSTIRNRVTKKTQNGHLSRVQSKILVPLCSPQNRWQIDVHHSRI